MRSFIRGASFVLCVMCICMAAVALITKIDDPRPKAATSAMTVWVYCAWAFAIIHYAALTGKRPPLADFWVYFRSAWTYAKQLLSSTMIETKKAFWPKSFLGWLAVAILSAFLGNLVFAAILNQI